MTTCSKSFLDADVRQDLIKTHRLTRDGRLRDRLKSILLLDQGWSYEQIAQALFLDDQTIRNYVKAYQDNSLEAFMDLNDKGRPSKLDVLQLEALKDHLDAITHLTADAIVEYIQKTYGVEYKRKEVIDLVHRLGFVYKKPKRVPGHPDPLRQELFVRTYEALKQELKLADEIVFLDSTHPQ